MDEPDGHAGAGEFVDDGERAVGRAGIDDDNLGDAREALEALADAGFLVLADDRRGNRQEGGFWRVRGHV